VVAVLVQLVQMVTQTTLLALEMAAQALPQALLGHQLHVLAVVALELIVAGRELVAQVVVATVRFLGLELLELLIPEVVAVVVIQVPQVGLAALVSLLFDMLTHLQPQHQPQAHPQSQWLAATVFTNGLDQGVSHSDGTLCKTQF
jgi:hypothetical protein